MLEKAQKGPEHTFRGLLWIPPQQHSNLLFQKVERYICIFSLVSESGLGIEIGHRQPECRRRPELTLSANPAVCTNIHELATMSARQRLFEQAFSVRLRLPRAH